MNPRFREFEIPNALWKENREKLVARLNEKGIEKNGILFFEGGKAETFYNTDTDRRFIQESNFLYLMGVNEIPGCYGMIELESRKATLFVEKLPESYAMWVGEIKKNDEHKKFYGVDDCLYNYEVPKVFGNLIKKRNNTKLKIYILSGENTNSKKMYKEINIEEFLKQQEKKRFEEEKDKEIDIKELLSNIEIEKDLFYTELDYCRSLKSELEIKVMEHTCKIASLAQSEMMKAVKPGLKEYQLEGVFNNYCYFNGGMRNSFLGICSSGKNSAILHYVDNQNTLKDGTLVLCDMGSKYYGYCSDITRTFPVNGKFSEKQKSIYSIVLKVQLEVMKRMKPGVKWVDMQELSYEIICEELKKLDILKSDATLQELIDHKMGRVFMFHGLGHFLGLDTHDVGGKKAGVLRVSRKLEESNVITVEPGLYFNSHVINKIKQDPERSSYLGKRLPEFMDFGGIRIEDDVLITKNGIQILTNAPKTIEEIEKIMQNNHNNTK